MAEVTVFVDDAVLGRLPGVCAKEGTPTGDRLRMRCPVGDGARLGILWLLVLTGPIGWIVLLAIVWSQGGRPETLTVELPLSAEAYGRIRAAGARVRSGTVLIGVGLVVFVATLVVAPSGSIALGSLTGWALVLIGLLAAVSGDRARQAASVGVDLDASRRWVTLRRVHPAFVAACRPDRRSAVDLP